MKRRAKETTKEREYPKIDPSFAPVMDAFSADPQVSRGDGKGFGSGAFKVNDKIFAMISSKGEFVVKLSKKRVDELVSAGKGERFDPGHGRLMKEWIAFSAGRAHYVELAKEAYRFVKESNP
jgi:hypothetical protein